MQYPRIALAAALQRYVDAPPVAVRQRDVAIALGLRQSGARVCVLSVEAPVALAPTAETLAQKLDAFAAPLVDAGLQVETTVRAGAPVATVLAWLREVDASVLVIGSHSKQSPLDITMGSTASVLWRSAPCPTILVRPTVEEADAAKDMMIPHYPWIVAYV